MRILRYFSLAFVGLIAISTTHCMFYHNTTARFNAYFLANERMMVVENSLFEVDQENFNEVLDVLVPIDTNLGKQKKGDLDYIIEKAALPTKWHEPSKWTPYCWILIGKARLYQGDIGNASNTFKYVNTEFQDHPDARHAALVQLMRTYIASGELNNVLYVRDYIQKEVEPLNEENTRDYHLVMAHYYRIKFDFATSVQHLERAVPLIKPRKKRARYYYLMGQMHELLKNEDKAYDSYSQARRRSPTYELEFHAKLMSQNFQDIQTEEDKREAYRFYEKLLEDEKNFNYRDKIYYEMAKFELRQDNEPIAMQHFNESVQVSTNNPTQKSYSYLKMGEIHLKNKAYTEAADYYDSAVRAMPKTTRGYEAIKEKAKILREFADQYQIVEAQDRLLALAEMTEEERMAFFEEEIAEEKAEIIRKDQYRLQAEAKRTPPPGSNDLARIARQSNDWYFYNDQAIQRGRQAFIEKWGGRPLEDHWRRSNKPMSQGGGEEENTADADTTTQNTAATDLFAGVKSVDEREKEVPLTDGAKKKVLDKLEEALYQLGRVYYFRLEDYPGTIKTFERLVQDFPKSKYATEVLFMLHRVCVEHKACDPEKYKKWLGEDYPDDVYTKLLIDPMYLVNKKKANEEAARIYEQGYALYKKGQYHHADSLMEIVIGQYAETRHVPRAELLQTMILGETTQYLGLYTKALDDFMKKYPNSELATFAQNLKKSMKNDEVLQDRLSLIDRQLRLDSLRREGEKLRRR